MSSIIVLASPHVDHWSEFARILQDALHLEVVGLRTGAEVLNAAREKKVIAMVVDASMEDITGVALVREIIQINAMIHIAMASDQPEADFHEETEGLGILMQVPLTPDAAAADRLAASLRQLGSVS
jgi:DNA-binding NarL/FixJ family response regulator